MTASGDSRCTLLNQPLNIHESGVPGGPLAILIHGWASSWFAVSPLLRLLDRRWHCLAVDLPGYGYSPKAKKRATIGWYVELIAELIRQRTDQPAILIGHSMGGMISLTLALRHPELVERLILICPTISGRLSLIVNLTLFPFVVLERFPLTNALVTLLEPVAGITDQLLRLPLFADRTALTAADFARIKADARRRDQGRIRAECFWAMRQNDLRGQLAGLQTPALFIWGMEDNTVPLRDASVVAREMPQADLRVIPNAGHWPQFEAADLTRRYIAGFIATPIKLLKMEF